MGAGYIAAMEGKKGPSKSTKYEVLNNQFTCMVQSFIKTAQISLIL